MPVLSTEERDRLRGILAAQRPSVAPVTPVPVAEEGVPISQYPWEIGKGLVSGSTAEIADLIARKGFESNVLDPATEGWGPYHVGYGLGALLGGPARLATGTLGLTTRLLPKVSPVLQAAIAGGVSNAPLTGISAAVQDEDPLAGAARGGVLGAGFGAAGAKLEPLLKHYFGRLAPSYAAKAGAEAVEEAVPTVDDALAGRVPPPRTAPPPPPTEAPTVGRTTGPPSPPKKGPARSYAQAAEEAMAGPPPPATPAMGLDPADLSRLGEETRAQNLRQLFPETGEGLPEISKTGFQQHVVNKIGDFLDRQFPDEEGLSFAAERDWAKQYAAATMRGEKTPKPPAGLDAFKKLVDEQIKDAKEIVALRAKTPRPTPTPKPDPEAVAALAAEGTLPRQTPTFRGKAIRPTRIATDPYASTRAVPTATTPPFQSTATPSIPEGLPPLRPVPIRLTDVVPEETMPLAVSEPTPLPSATPAFEPLPLPEEGLPPLPLAEAASPLPVTPEPVVTPAVQALPIDEKLYDQAKKLVAKQEQVGLTWLQRRLKIGYDRAEGIINRMEQEGLVSPPLQGERIGVPRKVLAPAPTETLTPTPPGPKRVDLTKAATLPIATTEPIQAALEALNPIRKELGVKQTWAAPLSKTHMLQKLQREQEEGTVEGRLEELLTPLVSLADVPGLTKRLGKPYGPLIDTLAKNWAAVQKSFDPAAYKLELAQQQIPPRVKKLLETGGSEATKQRRAIQLAIELREQLGAEGAETTAGIIPAGQFEGLGEVVKEGALPGGKIGSEATAVLSKVIVDLVGPERAQQLVQLVNTATDDKTLIKRATAIFKTALPAAAIAAGVTALQPDVAQAIQQEAPKVENDPAATYLKLNDMGHTDLTMEEVEQALQTQVSPAKKKAVRKLSPQAKQTYLDLITTDEDLAA